MKTVQSLSKCGSSMYKSPHGVIFTRENHLHSTKGHFVTEGIINSLFVDGFYCAYSTKDSFNTKAVRFDEKTISTLKTDAEFDYWPSYSRNGESFVLTNCNKTYKDGVFWSGKVFEYSLVRQTKRLIRVDFPWQIACSTSTHHYGHRPDNVTAICQLDHDLNVLWQIDEATLREYGKVDKDDPRAEKFDQRCAVRNMQVFNDTLYYLYNFSMIIALDVHTGAFKRRFSRFPDDYHSTYINPLNSVECTLMRDIDALHAGRYIEELHAFVIVRQEHLIEIDYETLTARARPIHVHHLWKNSMATTDPVVTMVGKDRIAVHAQFSKDVAILDYNSLEVMDFLRLDEEDPGGYLRGSLYHDGKLYVLTTAPSSAVKGCTLYEVAV